MKFSSKQMAQTDDNAPTHDHYLILLWNAVLVVYILHLAG